MARGKRKRRFSHVISQTQFDGRTLEVRGRMRLAAVLLLAFTLGIGVAVGSGRLPVFVSILAGLGGLLTLCGFIDTAFGVCWLKYDTQTQELALRRGSPFGKVEFKGFASGNVSVTRVRAGSTTHGQQPLYMIVFSVALEDAIANFQLQQASVSEEQAQAKIREWEAKLSLTPAPSSPSA